MANVSDYTFDNLTRIGHDQCFQSQESLQDQLASSYLLQNYFLSDCNLAKAKTLATSQPAINYKGGYGLGAGGCNVQESSNLLIGTIQTHPKSRIDLFHRPFATVPFLGRGSVDPLLESQIQQGDVRLTNKRTITQLTEKSHLKYNTTPLIPELQKTIQNPNNLVEGIAADGWVRGGLPSRELTRDKDFYTTHSPDQYV